MSAQNSFISGLRWVAAGRLSSQVISWLGTLFVMRTLLPQDYGLAALCFSVTAIVAIIAEFGMGASVIQAKTLSEPQLRSIFGASIVFSFGCALLLILAAPLAAWFFRAPEATNLIRAMALSFVIGPFCTIPDAMLRRDLKFRGLSIVDFGCAILTSLATVWMAWQGWGAWAIVLGPIAGSIARVFFINYLAPQRLWPSFDLRPAMSMLDFGLKVASSRLVGTVFGQSDVLIAGRFLSKPALGEYSVAMTLAMLPVSKAMSIINQVAYPTIAKINRESDDMQAVLLGGLRLFGYALIPLLWGMAAVANWLIPALIGPNWENAVLPLQIVCIALPIRMISVLLSSVLHGLGHAGMEIKCTMTGVVLLPICFLAGAPFGAVGLASAWLVGLPLMVAINVQRAKSVLGFGQLKVLRALSKPVALSACMSAVVLALGHAMAPHVAVWIVLAAIIPTGAITYLGLLWALDRSNASKLLAFFKIGS